MSFDLTKHRLSLFHVPLPRKDAASPHSNIQPGLLQIPSATEIH
jgi:hypothetical protein